MAKRSVKRIAGLFLILLTGCGNVSAVYHITRGNFYFFNNRLQESCYCYLREWDNEKYRNIVVYNLGTVYFHLGESRAAMEMWSGFRPESASPALQFRFYYNRALLKCEFGDFQGAFFDLKEALTIDPKNKEAKNNMEVVLDRMVSAPENTRAESRPAEREKDMSAASRRIIDYVKKSEVFEWENRDIPVGRNVKDW